MGHVNGWEWIPSSGGEGHGNGWEGISSSDGGGPCI